MKKQLFGVLALAMLVLFPMQDVFAQTATKMQVALTTEAGQPGYITCPQEHNALNSSVDGGGVPAMIDGDPSTYMHTAWSNVPAGPHYFQIDLGDGNALGSFAFYYQTRNGDVGYDFPAQFTIKGSNDDANYEQITVINVGDSMIGAGLEYNSERINSSNTYRYLRFEVTDTDDKFGVGYRTYFHIAEFKLYKYEEYVPQYNVTVSVNDAAMGSAAKTITGEEAYSLTATANSGYQFVNWTINGQEVSTANPYDYTATADVEIVANFEKVYFTNFGTSTATGKGALSKITFNINDSTQDVSTGKSSSSGDIYVNKVSEVVTIDAGTEITSLTTTGTVGNDWMHGYLYVDWNNDKSFTKELNNYVPSANSELIAYGFWTGTDGDGSHGGVDDSSGYNHKGNQVSDGTTPNRSTNGALESFTIPTNIPAGDYRARYKLDWNCVNPEAVLDLGYGAMVLDFTLRITQPIPSYTVTAQSANESMGTVSPSSAKVKSGETVTITATPNEGYEFVKWTVDGGDGPNTNPWTVPVTEDLDFVANFQIIPGSTTYNITVASADETMGTASASTLEVIEGNTVTLTATANEGYRFVNWTVNDEEVSTENPYAATISAETAFVANFEEIPTYTVTVTLPDAEQGSIEINGEAAQASYTVLEGTAVEMTATPAFGYIFSKWLINGNEYGDNPFSVPSVTVDATVEAVFTKLTDEEVYASICKPEYSHSGNNNNTYVSFAEINGESIEVPALVTPSNGNGNAQEGSTTPIEVVAGEEFILDLTFVRNFGDVRLFQIEKGNTIAPVKTYGPYEGSWVESGNHPNPLDAMAAEGLTVDGFKASFPFTFSESLPIGDIAIIRVAIGDCTTPCALGISEGGYVDFIFKMVPAPIPTYAVTAEASPVEGGQVTISANEVEENETVTLTATANEGYEFVNWTVEGTEVSTSESFTSEAINEETTFVANFVKKTYTVTVTATAGGTATTDAVNPVEHGTQITLTADANDGYEFVVWMVDGSEGARTDTWTIPVTEDLDFEAQFRLIQQGDKDVTVYDATEVNDAAYATVRVANEKVWDLQTTNIVADKVSVKVESNGVAPEVKISDGGQITTVLEISRVVEKGKWALMSLPFAVDLANVTVDGAPAANNSNIKVMVYDAAYRAANSVEDWTKSGWVDLVGTTIAANQGFAVAINANNGDEQTVTFTATAQTYDGADKQIALSRYASTVNGGADADWNFYGNPTLAKAQKGTGYALYVYNAEDDSYEEYASSDVATYLPYAAWFVQSADDFNAMSFSAGVAGALAEANGVYGELQFSLNGEDEARVVLVDDASEEYVRNEDALYFPAMNANLSQLYLVKGNMKMAVSEQPALTNMAMGYKAVKAGEQTLTLTSIPENASVVLVDNVAGTETAMTLGDTYTFQSEAGTFNNRFVIETTDLTGIAQAVADGEVKVIVSGDDIKVYGAEAGTEVVAYTTNGTVVASAVATDGVTTLSTTASGVIVVKVANTTVKVIK